MEKKNLYILLLIFGTAFWGISFSVTKLAVGHFSASTFLFYRFLTATVILSLIFVGQFKKTNWTSVRNGVVLSVPLLFGIYLQTQGIMRTSASQAAFVAGMSVVIIPVIKTFFHRTVAPVRVWLAAIVALAGLSVICVTSSFSVNIGDLYTLTGALGFAVYLIRVELYSKSGNIIATVVPMFAACTVLIGCLALGDSQADWMPQNTNFWIGVVFCAVFSTAYMYTVSNLSQRYLSAERVSIIYLFEPIFGAIAAFYLLGEMLSLRLFFGGILIFAATLISELNIGRNLNATAPRVRTGDK